METHIALLRELYRDHSALRQHYRRNLASIKKDFKAALAKDECSMVVCLTNAYWTEYWTEHSDSDTKAPDRYLFAPWGLQLFKDLYLDVFAVHADSRLDDERALQVYEKAKEDGLPEACLLFSDLTSRDLTAPPHFLDFLQFFV